MYKRIHPLRTSKVLATPQYIYIYNSNRGISKTLMKKMQVPISAPHVPWPPKHFFICKSIKQKDHTKKMHSWYVPTFSNFQIMNLVTNSKCRLLRTMTFSIKIIMNYTKMFSLKPGGSSKSLPIIWPNYNISPTWISLK